MKALGFLYVTLDLGFHSGSMNEALAQCATRAPAAETPPAKQAVKTSDVDCLGGLTMNGIYLDNAATTATRPE